MYFQISAYMIHSYVIQEFINSQAKSGYKHYRKISNIRRTQNQNLNDSRLIMQLPLPNPLKPGVKSRMKM